MATVIWTRSKVAADDILNGASSLSRNGALYGMNPIPDWTPTSEYLDWARQSLARRDAFGRDAAVCYAKRAVCRLIDSFLRMNHLGRFERSPYPEKLRLLERVGIVVPDIAHDLIIDPRNDIEHSYTGATEEQARRAVQLADLILTANSDEARRIALISLGGGLGYTSRFTDTPEIKEEEWSFRFGWVDPLLLIDLVGHPPAVMLLHPRDREIQVAELAEFDKDQAVALAKLLRENQEAASPTILSPEVFGIMKEQIEEGVVFHP